MSTCSDKNGVLLPGILEASLCSCLRCLRLKSTSSVTAIATIINAVNNSVNSTLVTKSNLSTNYF